MYMTFGTSEALKLKRRKSSSRTILSTFADIDVIQFTNGSKYTVKFVKSSFVASDGWGFHSLSTLKTSEAEIVGHVDD